MRGIDLEVRRGEIFAFLGPNGAGKTTTVEILEGFRQASGGRSRCSAEPLARAGELARADRDRAAGVRGRAGPDRARVPASCTPATTARRARSTRRSRSSISSEQADQRATALSGGQRRRLDVALALIGDPELIFLDEPTTGFDPSARRAAWEVIAGLRDLGKTVFLTTHYMEEAERLADRIAVIAAGEIVAEGTPQTLGGRQLGAAQITFALPERHDRRRASRGAGRVASRSAGGRPARAAQHDRGRRPARAVRVGARARPRARDLEVRRPTLEDVYLKLHPQQPKELTMFLLIKYMIRKWRRRKAQQATV